jgi:hypothetical protein
MRVVIRIAKLLFGLLLTPSFAFSEYYTFQEDFNRASFNDPLDMSYKILQATSNLLNWRLNSDVRPLPPIKYNRLEQFGTWIRDPRTGSCLNTRARVLGRDSDTPVQFAENNNCRVELGTWNDPYTRQNFTQAKDVDVDHVVALKNAYDSGAFNWSRPYRCLYTNFTGFKNQLLAVSARENQIKSDKGPERWMPPNSQFSCQHLQNWLAVKFIWRLNMSDLEVKAIRHFVMQLNCPAQMFQANKIQVLKMRDLIERDVVICKNTPPLTND